jgi:hypothetical protein
LGVSHYKKRFANKSCRKVFTKKTKPYFSRFCFITF